MTRLEELRQQLSGTRGLLRRAPTARSEYLCEKTIRRLEEEIKDETKRQASQDETTTGETETPETVEKS